MLPAQSTSQGDSAAANVERRLGRRHRVFLAGKALARDRLVDVTFRDLSSRGARLLVSEPIAHAGELPVLLLREGLVLRSRIVWARPPMFGLEICEAIDVRADCPERFAALSEAWRAWKLAQPD
jgi:hypothetical protein